MNHSNVPRGALGARVRRVRLERGLTLRDTERQTGVSRSMLSKIERGRASPTATVLGKLAEGLKISISQLIGGPVAIARRHPVLLRVKNQPVFRVARTGFERRSLSPVGRGRTVDLVVNILPPGQSSGEFPPHRAGVRETLAVSAGQLQLVLGRRKFKLGAGDAIFYGADVGHRFDNPSATDPAVFYIVIDYSRVG